MFRKKYHTVLPLLLLVFIIGISSCKKENSVKAIITVLHDTTELTGTDTAGNGIYDTISGPVAGAEVRMWLDRPGAVAGDTVYTGTNGIAEFEFAEPLILRLEVVHVGYHRDFGLVPLDEEGDVVEKTVNLDAP